MSRRKFCKTCQKITKYKFDDVGDTYCTECGNMHYNWLSGNKKYVVIALFVIAMLFIVKYSIPEPIPNPNNFTEEQISCLELQYHFYGAEWCVHCSNQKKALGQVVVDKVYIDCDENRAKCQNIGIQGYPFNVMFDKDTGNLTTITGELAVDKILEYTGCGVQ